MAIDQKIVLLVGGVGGAKLALGLAEILSPENLTIIVNTGDDFWHYGLRICPDLDTVMYTLSGLVDPVNGWGVGGDTTITLDSLKRYGENPWFRLGDQDLATHLLRTHLLRSGVSLTDIVTQLSGQLGIQHTLLPMTDTPVATMINTVEMGEIEFQSYFVEHRWQPTVKSLRIEGIEKASITEIVQERIDNADAIIIGPSNPWLSIQPILSVPGICDALVRRNIPRVAVTPIVSGKALKGPAAKIMGELNLAVTPQTVAEFYGNVINGFIYDKRDNLVKLNDVKTLSLDTIMKETSDKIRLAREMLDWIGEWAT